MANPAAAAGAGKGIGTAVGLLGYAGGAGRANYDSVKDALGYAEGQDWSYDPARDYGAEADAPRTKRDYNANVDKTGRSAALDALGGLGQTREMMLQDASGYGTAAARAFEDNRNAQIANIRAQAGGARGSVGKALAQRAALDAEANVGRQLAGQEAAARIQERNAALQGLAGVDAQRAGIGQAVYGMDMQQTQMLAMQQEFQLKQQQINDAYRMGLLSLEDAQAQREMLMKTYGNQSRLGALGQYNANEMAKSNTVAAEERGALGAAGDLVGGIGGAALGLL